MRLLFTILRYAWVVFGVAECQKFPFKYNLLVHFFAIFRFRKNVWTWYSDGVEKHIILQNFVWRKL